MPESSTGRAAGSTAPRTRGAGVTSLGGEPKAVRAFGAVVGPKFTRCATQEGKGIEISQLDRKHAEVTEIFCTNWFTSGAPSFAPSRVCD